LCSGEESETNDVPDDDEDEEKWMGEEPRESDPDWFQRERPRSVIETAR